MSESGKPGSEKPPAGLDGLDDIEPPENRTSSGVPAAAGAPRRGLDGPETLRRLLDDESLGFAEEDAKGTSRRIQPNPRGLKKGYDPYDSGMLVKKQWKRKKDLRALSRWIEQKKKLEDGR
jgi:hypothetical protein